MKELTLLKEKIMIKRTSQKIAKSVIRTNFCLLFTSGFEIESNVCNVCNSVITVFGLGNLAINNVGGVDYIVFMLI